MLKLLKRKSKGLAPRTSVAAPSLVPEIDTPVPHPDLLTVDDAKALSVEGMTELFNGHLNPGQYHFMKLLGFHKIKIEHAEGMYYTDQNGRKILDFFGGFGSLSLGHNHPRIIAARKAFGEEKRHEIAMAFLSQYASALAANLARIAPGDLDMVFLGSSGSEAMEARLKVAEKVQGPKRSRVLYAENAFHGKTRGALSITDSEMYQSQFGLLENRTKVPFGDLDAIRAALDADPSIGIVCLETIQGGGGIIEAPADFWVGLASPVRRARRALDCRRSAVGDRPFRSLLRLRALRRRPRCNGAGQIPRRRQDGDGRHDRPPRHLHESLWQTGHRPHPRPRHLRRHRRSMRYRHRRSQRHVRRASDGKCSRSRRLSEGAVAGFAGQVSDAYQGCARTGLHDGAGVSGLLPNHARRAPPCSRSHGRQAERFVCPASSAPPCYASTTCWWRSPNTTATSFVCNRR